MRAWVFDGPRQLRLDERAVPEPGPDQARIRVRRAGICGSDSHGYAGESGTRVPGVVMGHEASGVVDALGSHVAGLSVGEAVTFCPTLPCDGACGHTIENRCLKLRIIGVNPEWPGAFAEYVAVPAGRVVPLGGVSVEVGALVEPFAVGLHEARRAGVGAGLRVIVLGGGMIGQAAAQAACLLGAAQVVVSELNAERRAVAEASGVQAVPPEGLGELGQFDCAIDAVGLPGTVTAAVRAVGKGGTVCLVGLGQPRVTLELPEVVTTERTLLGSAAYTRSDFVDALDALRDGRLQAQHLSTREVAFDAAGAALEALVDGRETAIKVSLLLG
jgi:2-desacetyl-2-hydroxyethyl bacteriochlorophyllide A dehydrogenase